MTKLALVRVRGPVDVKQEIRDAFRHLNLHRRMYCTVIENTKDNLGMIAKVKDYATYGEIDDATLKLLVEKRSEKRDDGTQKPFFRLSPPRGGFERKGVKQPFSKGGTLGYRGAKINALIKKMV